MSRHWLERPPMLYRMRRLKSACPRRQIPLDAPREADALHRYRPGQQNAHTAANSRTHTRPPISFLMLVAAYATADTENRTHPRAHPCRFCWQTHTRHGRAFPGEVPHKITVAARLRDSISIATAPASLACKCRFKKCRLKCWANSLGFRNILAAETFRGGAANRLTCARISKEGLRRCSRWRNRRLVWADRHSGRHSV